MNQPRQGNPTTSQLLNLKDIRQEKTYRAEASLRSYIRQAWNVVEPSTHYYSNWHIDAICEHLEAVSNGNIKNLLINMPPRHGKSLIVSVFWPTWLWIHKPQTRWIFASYALSLAIRDSLKCRNVITSNWYQNNWGNVYNLLDDQNLKARFDNNRTGSRLALSVGSATTGEGAEYIVCLHKDTLVRTDNGNIRIDEIVDNKLPVKILSYNHEKNINEWKNILEYKKNPGRESVRVTFSNGKYIDVTDRHKIYTTNKGYVEARDLKQGDNLRETRNENISVRSVEPISTPEYVYNLNIEDNHNYYASNVLMRNCDDAHNVTETESDVMMRNTIDWWDQAMSTRLNNPRTGGKVIVMQRIKQYDLSGHVLEQGGYVHLNLPAEYEQHKKCITAIGWSDPRKKDGELLWPDRIDKEVLDNFKKVLGPVGYAGQFQQRPMPSEGGQFQYKWFKYFTQKRNQYILESEGQKIEYNIDECWRFMTVDLAISLKQTADYTVICTWAVTPENDLLLIDRIRDRMDNPTQQKVIASAFNSNEVDYIKIESVAYQLSLVQQLRKSGFPVREFKPIKDKVSRATTASVYYEGGNVYHPKKAPWLSEWEEELLLFPNAQHDDQCILPDTNLVCSQGNKLYETVKAQDLKIGDSLLTHNGKWKKIEQVMISKYSGLLTTIKPQGNFALSLTPNHPVYCIKNNCSPQWVKAENVVPGDIVLDAIDNSITAIDSLDMTDYLKKERFTNSSRLSRIIITNSRIKLNNPRSHAINRHVPVNGNLCRLIGYYIAEGSRGKHNVAWSFNENEHVYHEDVKNILKDMFDTTPSYRTKDHCTTLSVSSLVLHDFFSQFGRGAKNKNIPEWIMHLPIHLQKEFVKGMWRGDGCKTKNDDFVYVSCSKSLIMSLRMILYRLGIVPSISVTRKDGKYGGTIRGVEIGYSHPLYMLIISKSYCETFSQIMDIPITKNKRKANGIVNGYVQHIVKKVSSTEYDGLVYNFTIEDDHSYQTESCLVHNCDNASMACEEIYKPRHIGGIVFDTSDIDHEKAEYDNNNDNDNEEDEESESEDSIRAKKGLLTDSEAIKLWR